ncbi:MAG: transcriptional regulator NrdR [Ruminococcus sp.]|jgi:transcriptional repressor NrdR|nr:transcriptional regulator NrdR [Ruminococcus sp.]
MKCPYCNYTDSRVFDSRDIDDNTKRRRRECASCKKRWTTYEIVEILPLMVKKRNGNLEPFDRNKLMRGMITAIKKRPIGTEILHNIARNVETYYFNEMKTEITSEEIGQIVLSELKKIDPIAYVRFASVYENFTDVESFVKKIMELET